MNDEELSRLLQRHATRHPASEALRAALRTQAALHSAATAPAPAPRRRLLAGAALAAAGMLAGVASTLAVQAWQASTAASSPLAGELVAAHVQALRDGPLIQVASSDRHQVKPWFQGRIDYAPTVPDALPGFTLLGGRVQSLAGQATAVLALQVRLHKIDVFIRPADGVRSPERLQQRGFNIVQWRDGAMQYWAVSDLEGAELLQLARLWPAPLH